MFSSLNAFNSLSPALRTAIDKKQITGDFTAQALLEQMRALAEFDRKNVLTRSQLRKWKWLAIVLGIVVLFISPLPFVLRVCIFVAAIAAVIYLSMIIRRLSQFAISENFSQVALPFIAILKQDMQAAQTLSIRLDLTPAIVSKKCTGTSKPYERGAYKKIVDTTYRDPWFDGSARLADDAILRWRLLDTICESKRSKRSSSGKTKTKLRHYKRSLVAIGLSLPNKFYGVNAAADRSSQKATSKITVHQGDKRSDVKLVRKFKAKSLQPLDPRALIDMISEAYKRATPPTRSAA
ncbi:hypothetical protein ELE36_13060 [Pseudolysobacter antarcticus]|uniref:Uncharacterized protein n=1 Tax=Pseudolysobacter antarcticus TaxID=2511995 RepID=A0A411HLF7_9GAMM|nr:hypothetical protein [Pseudolysobacter antarcticus]QBB71207.1 hypothetical protein ELE36_13060 [Pseudolysobacter antarcticus]